MEISDNLEALSLVWRRDNLLYSNTNNKYYRVINIANSMFSFYNSTEFTSRYELYSSVLLPSYSDGTTLSVTKDGKTQKYTYSSSSRVFISMYICKLYSESSGTLLLAADNGSGDFIAPYYTYTEIDNGEISKACIFEYGEGYSTARTTNVAAQVQYFNDIMYAGYSATNQITQKSNSYRSLYSQKSIPNYKVGCNYFLVGDADDMLTTDSYIIEYILSRFKLIGGATLQEIEDTEVTIENSGGNVATVTVTGTISTITYTNSGTLSILKVESEIGETASVTWDQSKTPLGLYYNNKLICEPNETVTGLSLSGDFVFYEKVQGVYTPTDITLYQNTSTAERLDKTDYLKEVGTLKGVVRDTTSIVDLTIDIQQILMPDYNYVYFPDFRRYYFVTDITSVRYDMWRLSLHCDVLMTYKDSLFNCMTFIDRNENTYNSLVIDDKLPLQQGQTVTTNFIDNDVYVNQGQYILTGLLVSAGDSADTQSLNLDIGEEVDTIDDEIEITEQGGENNE